MCGCLQHTPYPGPGMYPVWELNQQPFGSQAGTQSTEPHQPGHILMTYPDHTNESQTSLIRKQPNKKKAKYLKRHVNKHM